jgi:hypothetical protein
MNNTQLYIPKKCKVGMQMREETYTGRLGYIIYNDGKVWRKEPSWENWRHKEGEMQSDWDKKKRQYTSNPIIGVEPIEFDNVPTTGFVLNKKAGGYATGWNHRQTYCRVYDPRGWEFEISIPNLLFILEECSSFKGKGLEGELVYSWDGKDLVLLPVASNDYKLCNQYTELQGKKVGVKDLVEGCTYITSKQENWTYLGRHMIFENEYGNFTPLEANKRGVCPEKKKMCVFVNNTENVDDNEEDEGTYDGFSLEKENKYSYSFVSSLSRIKEKVSDEIHKDYANMIDDFLKSPFYSPAVMLTVEPLDERFNFHQHYYMHLYRLNGIRSVGDLDGVRIDTIYKNGETLPDLFKVRLESSRYSSLFYNNDSVEQLTTKQIKEKYGKLMRVYESGIKREV